MSKQMFDIEECHLWVPDTMVEPSFPVTKEELEDAIRYCAKDLIANEKENYSLLEIADMCVLVNRTEHCHLQQKPTFDVRVMKIIGSGYTDDRVEIEHDGQ